MKRYMHLIRHGTTEANQKNMFYGHTDLPVTKEGISEIKEFKAKGIYPTPRKAAYYTSGLIRTEQTFTNIYGDIPRIRLEDLKEFSFGVFEMRLYEDLIKDKNYLAWTNDKSGNAAPQGGESFNEFKTRVQRAMETILDSKEEHSVVVCHGGVICVMMASCFPDEQEDMNFWIPAPARGYTVTIDGEHKLDYTAF